MSPNLWLDFTIGLFIGGVLIWLMHLARGNPFDIPELDNYERAYGEGPVTVTPETPSEWIAWGCNDRMPPGVRMHTRVQVRYVNGQMSRPRYASCFYWGRYMRYPAHGSHIAAYRIVNN